MFSRTYQLRSRVGGLVPVGEVLQEMVERAAIRQSFYRPKRQISPAAEPIKKMAPTPGAGRANASQERARGARGRHGGPLQGVQLELFHVEPEKVLARDQERPLLDLIPEAYQ